MLNKVHNYLDKKLLYDKLVLECSFKLLGGKMAYKLVYKFDGKEKVEYNHDPKVLREILNALEESGVKYFFELFNDGGIKLDSSEEQEKEREEEKKKKKK